MGEFIRSPTCNVLLTCDVSHMINFTRLSPSLVPRLHLKNRGGARGHLQTFYYVLSQHIMNQYFVSSSQHAINTQICRKALIERGRARLNCCCVSSLSWLGKTLCPPDYFMKSNIKAPSCAAIFRLGIVVLQCVL